ncbi:MAG: YggT family protein [Alphaproteobacteria bacterium]|nr:YggT family protein [Alphaproteobacteria bacterium]
MSLIGLVLFLYSVIVLFEIVTRMLEKHNVIDSTKNETLKKLMDLAGKMTNPVYAKVTELLPEKYRVVAGIESAPILLFLVMSILGQMML